MGSPRLTIHDLCYEESGRTILRNLNLTLQEGEALGLYDPTGLSYLPLLQICATLLKPKHGEVCFDGIPVPLGNELALFNLRRKIAYITTDSALVSSLTLVQNVSLAWAYHGNKSLEKTWDIGEELLDYFRIQHYRNSRPTSVGSEIIRRTICARELAKKPVLILLDSVVEGLSSEGQTLFLSYVEQYVQDTRCSLLMASAGTSFLSFFAKLIGRPHVLIDGVIRDGDEMIL